MNKIQYKDTSIKIKIINNILFYSIKKHWVANPLLLFIDANASIEQRYQHEVIKNYIINNIDIIEKYIRNNEDIFIS